MRLGLLVVLFVSLGSVGCGEKGESYESVAPEVDLEAVVERVMTRYDKNGDGSLSVAEISKNPNLVAQSIGADGDLDGVLSKHEVLKAVRMMASGSDKPIAVTVARRRGVVAGAKVKFTPEKFMGEGWPSAEGVAGADGVAVMHTVSIDGTSGEDLVPTGFYRVTITHGGKSYGAGLGYQVTKYDRNEGKVRFDLAKLKLKKKKK